MVNKKGQAAMEFLMTYGWAILVVLIAIGALAYFGVLNPGKYLPSSCTISNQIGCNEFRAVAGATTPAVGLTLILQNGRGTDLNISNVYLLNQNPSIACTPLKPGTGSAWTVAWATPVHTMTVVDGSNLTVQFVCTGSMPTVGGKYKANVLLEYQDVGSSLGWRNATGTITTKTE